MSDLRKKLIRLAHENPSLRGHLLPVLKEAMEFNVLGKHILDKARVFGNAMVTDNAVVFGLAQVSGRARIGGSAVIMGGTWDGSEGEITSGKWLAPGVPG